MTSTREYYFNGKTVWYNNGNEYPGGIYVDTIYPYTTSTNTVTFPNPVTANSSLSVGGVIYANNSLSANTINPLSANGAVTVGSGQQWGVSGFSNGGGTSVTASVIGTPNTFALSTTLNTVSSNVTTFTTGPKLGYSGARTKEFLVTGTYTASSGSSSQVLSCYIFHNGASIATSKTSQLTAATSPSAATPVSNTSTTLVSLVNGDTVTLGFSIDTGSNTTMTIYSACLTLNCVDNN